MSTSLYALAAEYQAASEKLHDTELDEQTIADTLEGMAGDVETKLINYAFVSKNLRGMASLRRAEIKKQQAKAEAEEKRADYMDRAALSVMLSTDIKKIDSPYFKLAVRENPPSVVIDDAGELPCELYVYPEAPAPYPDKKAIAERLKSGAEVQGAHLERGKRLDIR